MLYSRIGIRAIHRLCGSPDSNLIPKAISPFSSDLYQGHPAYQPRLRFSSDREDYHSAQFSGSSTFPYDVLAVDCFSYTSSCVQPFVRVQFCTAVCKKIPKVMGLKLIHSESGESIFTPCHEISTYSATACDSSSFKSTCFHFSNSGLLESGDFGRTRTSSGKYTLNARRIIYLSRHHGNIGRANKYRIILISIYGWRISTGRHVTPGSKASNTSCHNRREKDSYALGRTGCSLSGRNRLSRQRSNSPARAAKSRFNQGGILVGADGVRALNGLLILFCNGTSRNRKGKEATSLIRYQNWSRLSSWLT